MDELCQEKIIDEDLAERIRKEIAKDAASSLVYQCVCVPAPGAAGGWRAPGQAVHHHDGEGDLPSDEEVGGEDEN